MMLCSDNGTAAAQVPAADDQIKSDQSTTEPPLVVSAVELMPTTPPPEKEMDTHLTKGVVGAEGSKPKRTMIVSRPRVHPHQKQLDAKMGQQEAQFALAAKLEKGIGEQLGAEVEAANARLATLHERPL